MGDGATGVYSTIRTVGGGRRLVELDRHLERLSVNCDVSKQPILRRQVLEAIMAVVPCDGREYRITVKMTVEGAISVCHEPLPSYPADGGVSVQLTHLLHRTNPTIKSLAWQDQRQALKPFKLPDSEDFILVDADGSIREGTSCNFAILDAENVIRMAPEGTVLTGTMMKVITETILPKMGITWRSDAPQEQELPSYQAAFITSTSRLLLPVDKIYLDQQGGDTVIRYSSSDNELLHQIRKLLEEEIIGRSTPFR